MITQKILREEEVEKFLEGLDQPNLLKNYVISFERNEKNQNINAKYIPYVLCPSGNKYPLIFAKAANEKYYKKPIDKHYMEGTTVESVVLIAESSGLSKWRFIIGNKPVIYEYINGLIFVDDDCPKASFVFAVNKSIDGLFHFFISDGKKWNDFDNENKLIEHSGLTDNPHKVDKIDINLGNVINEEQVSYETFMKHKGSFKNPHGVTKETIGLGNVINEKQVSETTFSDHMNNKSNPHGITKYTIGLGNVIDKEQIPYEIFADHVKDKSSHEISKEQLQIDKVPNILQASLKDFNIHLNDGYAHNLTKEQIGLGNVTNVQQVSEVMFMGHQNDTNNPHKVTKEKLGLSNVNNEEQCSVEEWTLHVNKNENPHNVTRTQLGLDKVLNIIHLGKVQFDLHKGNVQNPHVLTKDDFDLSEVVNEEQCSSAQADAHFNNTSNPHVITPAQLGLGNISPSLIQYPKDDFIVNHASNTNNPHEINKDLINLGKVENIDHLTRQVLTDHMNDTNNPHKLTKELLGLENVENVPDVNKKISAAFILALQEKIPNAPYNLIKFITSSMKVDVAYYSSFVHGCYGYSKLGSNKIYNSYDKLRIGEVNPDVVKLKNARQFLITVDGSTAYANLHVGDASMSKINLSYDLYKKSKLSSEQSALHLQSNNDVLSKLFDKNNYKDHYNYDSALGNAEESHNNILKYLANIY